MIKEKSQKVLSKDLTYGYRVLGFFDDAVDPFVLISPLWIVLMR
jgi:undecaprenyl-phosphate galactose phosphotransferase/putative colanic acid biosynthesis UDP-glucose lipid carrier transferase